MKQPTYKIRSVRLLIIYGLCAFLYVFNVHAQNSAPLELPLEWSATNATLTSGAQYAPGQTGTTNERGRILLSNFPVNGSGITADHVSGLNELINLLKSSPSYKLKIEGRASDTGREPNNIQLSLERANAVAQYLLGHDIDTSNTEITAHGSSSPLVLANGEVDGNRSVMITYDYAGALVEIDRIPVPIPDPIVSKRWGLALDFSGGGGHVLTGWGAMGELKNFETGETYEVSFLVMGVGEGFATPGVTPPIEDDDFVSFETNDLVPAISFHQRYTRVSTLGGGLGVIGGGLAIIRIPQLTDAEITVTGLTLGTVGADVTFGLGGIIWLEESSANKAREELREYERRVEEYNRSIQAQ